jgi:hypothetical protein
MGIDGQSRVHFGQGTQGDSYGAHRYAERTSKEGSNIFIAALRRQLECRACDKRIRGVQPAHDERTPSLEEGARRAWAPAFVRVDTIGCKQIRRRTVTSFLTWRPSNEIDSAAFRRGWDDGAPRLVSSPATRRTPRLSPPPVPQRIGISLVPQGNVTALSASGTHGSSGEEATDIQSTCPPPNARLAEAIMVPAGHGHEHQGASPAASPGRSLDRDTTTESILASPAPRNEPASRRAPVTADPALTRFPFDGSDMTTGGAARARPLLEDFAWSTRTIGSRSTQ